MGEFDDCALYGYFPLKFTLTYSVNVYHFLSSMIGSGFMVLVSRETGEVVVNIAILVKMSVGQNCIVCGIIEATVA